MRGDWFIRLLVNLVGEKNVLALQDWLQPAQFYWLALSILAISAGVIGVFHTVVPDQGPQDQKREMVWRLGAAIAAGIFGSLLLSVIRYVPANNV